MAAMLKGILLPSKIAAKTIFCLYLVKRLNSYAQMCCKTLPMTSSFQHFSLKGMYKICLQKEIIHILKITIWSRDQLGTYSF